MYGMNKLKEILSNKQLYVSTRYAYYNMKYEANDLGISTPSNIRLFKTVLGWNGKAVDSVADRITMKRVDDSTAPVNDLNKLMNVYKTVLLDKCILDSVISSCSFAYVYGQNGQVKMQPIDGFNATGIIDETNNMLKEGYAVLERDKDGKPSVEAYFTSDSTIYYYSDGTSEEFDNPTNYPLLIPFVYKPSTTKAFGKSKISKACIDLVECACRTIKRSEITSEFYSFPQKYVVGTQAPEEEEGIDNWKATATAFMEIYQNENGSNPSIGQFNQASVAPHIEQLKMYASLFGAETNLTLEDLGFPTSVPSSQETVKAIHEGLRLDVEKAKERYEISIQNLLCVASSLRDGINYSVDGFRNVSIIWKPSFALDNSAIASICDGLLKMQQAFPGYLSDSTVEVLTGIEKVE